MNVRGEPRAPIPPDVPREQQRVIKDKVVVRDDSGISAAIMLGALIALLLIGGAVMYAFSGDRQNAPTNMPPAISSQRATAPTPAPERAPAPTPPKAQ